MQRVLRHMKFNSREYWTDSMHTWFFVGFGDEHEYRLTKYLLDGYDAGVRPAKNSSQPLAVVFGLSLHHIIDVVSTDRRLNDILQNCTNVQTYKRNTCVSLWQEIFAF